MKIDSTIKPVGGLAAGNRKGSTEALNTGASSNSAHGAGSGVELSSLSARMQQIESHLANSPVADSARVDAIRAAISSGAFKIDASKIADGLIDNVRQMLSPGK